MVIKLTVGIGWKYWLVGVKHKRYIKSRLLWWWEGLKFIEWDIVLGQKLRRAGVKLVALPWLDKDTYEKNTSNINGNNNLELREQLSKVPSGIS